MEKFSKVKSIPAYLSLQNIDTDMIIPKQFLKTIKRTGLGKSLFYEMRYEAVPSTECIVRSCSVQFLTRARGRK